MDRDGLLVRLDRIPYREAWDLQRRIAEGVRDGRLPHTVLLVEHPPVYTIGRSGSLSNVLLDDASLQSVGAELIRVDRGGDVTFHGPGQIVGYPILDLASWGFGAVDYVRALEQALILLLDQFNIRAERVPGRVGVWVNGAKVAAIGVRISRGITYHGFALNVVTDLRFFDYIIPCGIADSPVTSMEQLVGREISVSKVQDRLVELFGSVFGINLVETSREKLAMAVAAAPSDYD